LKLRRIGKLLDAERFFQKSFILCVCVFPGEDWYPFFLSSYLQRDEMDSSSSASVVVVAAAIDAAVEVAAAADDDWAAAAAAPLVVLASVEVAFGWRRRRLRGHCYNSIS